MRRFLETQSVVFDPETLRVVAAAFDDAWASVTAGGDKLDGNAEAVRELLAKHIMEMAQEGEFDQRRLCDGALMHLRTEGLTWDSGIRAKGPP